MSRKRSVVPVGSVLCLLGLLAFPGPTRAATSTQIPITGGSHAGTYPLAAENVVCI
jgi:hypothetical protein